MLPWNETPSSGIFLMHVFCLSSLGIHSHDVECLLWPSLSAYENGRTGQSYSRKGPRFYLSASVFSLFLFDAPHLNSVNPPTGSDAGYHVLPSLPTLG